MSCHVLSRRTQVNVCMPYMFIQYKSVCVSFCVVSDACMGVDVPSCLNNILSKAHD